MRRAIGDAAGGTLALALLVCCCVFTALAGPALSLHTRTQALRHELAGLPGATKAVNVTASLGQFVSAAFGRQQNVDAATLAESTVEIGNGLHATPLPLAGGDWASLNTIGFLVTAGAAASAYTTLPPKLAVYYRDPFTSYARLVAGSYDARTVPAGMVGVAATTQTAARFGLHPGSRLTVRIPGGLVTVVVTGIVAERAAGSTFWTEDATPRAPQLQGSEIQRPYWLGGVIADPGQLAAMQNAFNGPGIVISWEFPLALGSLNADQVRQLADALNRATAVNPTLTGPLAAAAISLTVGAPLLQDLSQFVATQAAVGTVLLLPLVSLIAVGAAVILLAARMIVSRRAGELAMLRARGGSARQVAAAVARGTAVAVVPAALAGAVLAMAVVPGNGRGIASGPAGWSLAGLTVAAALAGPPLVAAWRYRRAAPAANQARITVAGGRRRRTAWRRPVAEITAIAACVGGLIVLHDQGVSTSGGANLYLTVAPVLVAVPVVLVMLRLYPLAVRGMLALSARSAGATGFVALSGAARSSLIGVLPAFGLVLALTLATFAGMLSQGITRGEVAASWQATGADVLISAGPESIPVSPAAVRAIAAVRGVQRATVVWTTSWVTTAGQPVTAVAVDPASYAALTADTSFPAFPGFGSSSSRGTIPVLASPSAAAIIGRGTTLQDTEPGIGPITVRVTGPLLSSTPAVPGGGAFIVMPLQNLPGQFGRAAPNMVLVTGSSIDDAQLSAVTDKVITANSIVFRSQVLAGLSNSPLQHGATLMITLTIADAVAFGLFIVILGVALGSAEREQTVARLAVMGHERATWLIMTEALPALVAAIAAGAACAVVLPRAIGSAIDLSAFTGTSIPVGFQLDRAALGLSLGPAAAIALLAVAVLAGQARALRRDSAVTGLLREGI